MIADRAIMSEFRIQYLLTNLREKEIMLALRADFEYSFFCCERGTTYSGV